MEQAQGYADLCDRTDLPELTLAWRAAMRHAGPGPGFRVGVCDRAGRVFTGTMLNTYLQVKTFSRHLARQGYVPLVVGSPEDMQGCDVLFMRRDCLEDVLDAGGGEARH